MIVEYCDEPDPIKIGTVATMLRKAPGSLVWDIDFVRTCLRAADICDQHSVDTVQNALHSALMTDRPRAVIGQSQIGDIERRGTAGRLAEQVVRGTVEEQFYRALARSADKWFQRDLPKFSIPADGRDW